MGLRSPQTPVARCIYGRSFFGSTILSQPTCAYLPEDARRPPKPRAPGELPFLAALCLVVHSSPLITEKESIESGRYPVVSVNYASEAHWLMRRLNLCACLKDVAARDIDEDVVFHFPNGQLPEKKKKSAWFSSATGNSNAPESSTSHRESISESKQSEKGTPISTSPLSSSHGSTMSTKQSLAKYKSEKKANAKAEASAIKVRKKYFEKTLGEHNFDPGCTYTFDYYEKFFR